MEVALELILVGLIVKVLYRCLYIVKRECFGIETDQIDSESALQVLSHRESRLLQT